MGTRGDIAGPVARVGRRAGLLLAALALGACAGGPDFVEGAPRLSAADRGRVQFKMLDAVNAIRTADGATPLGLDPALTAAAATHSRDMAAQNRPWHFGSDGSSPPLRAARAGYDGAFRGEAISESFETEIETLAAWMQDGAPRGVVLDPLAREMGLGWHQERNGKVWWTLVTGTPDLPASVPVPAGPGGLAGPTLDPPQAPYAPYPGADPLTSSLPDPLAPPVEPSQPAASPPPGLRG